MPESVATSERRALCDLFEKVGPDAPTLCAGWSTYDLAVHLVVREHNPLAGAGIVVSRLSGFTDKAMASEKAKHDYPQVVAAVRKGPPFGPMRWLNDTVNLQEFFVHHEDVRRANGMGHRADTVVEAALEAALKRGHRIATRNLKGIGVDLVLPSGETIRSRDGEPRAAIVGPAGEIVLYLMGRREAAEVTLEGSDEAIARIRTAKLGV